SSVLWVVGLCKLPASQAAAGPEKGRIVATQTQKTSIYAVRTTSGQERTVVDLMASRIQPKKLPIVAILAPEVIKGYIFVEAMGPHFVNEAIAGTRHARTRTKATVSPASITRTSVT